MLSGLKIVAIGWIMSESFRYELFYQSLWFSEGLKPHIHKFISGQFVISYLLSFFKNFLKFYDYMQIMFLQVGYHYYSYKKFLQVKSHVHLMEILWINH